MRIEVCERARACVCVCSLACVQVRVCVPEVMLCCFCFFERVCVHGGTSGKTEQHVRRHWSNFIHSLLVFWSVTKSKLVYFSFPGSKPCSKKDAVPELKKSFDLFYLSFIVVLSFLQRLDVFICRIELGLDIYHYFRSRLSRLLLGVARCRTMVRRMYGHCQLFKFPFKSRDLLQESWNGWHGWCLQLQLLSQSLILGLQCIEIFLQTMLCNWLLKKFFLHQLHVLHACFLHVIWHLKSLTLQFEIEGTIRTAFCPLDSVSGPNRSNPVLSSGGGGGGGI